MPDRTKRIVKYRKAGDMWHYATGVAHLPVQWSSWMSHTRPHPPTLEELQADFVRQQRVLANARLIAQRDQEERERLRITQSSSTPGELDEIALNEVQGKASRAVTSEAPPPTAASPTATPLPNRPADDNYQPESWSPKTLRRGG
ncbi:hypothetical protein FRC02_003357 [Tulasnella sp. 418]|nr:hypothetical protein FRC02_003357 [Tulasnella sp. 418]